MATFNYKALDRGGKEIRGRVEAGTECAVMERLRNMGYYPSEVRKARGQNVGRTNLEDLPVFKQLYRLITRGKVKQSHLTTFTRQLATLTGAGLPLLRSLRIAEEQVESSNLKKALAEVIEDIEEGSTLSEALARHPKIFNKLYTNMVKAGEIGGALEEVLKRLAIFAEKSRAIKSKVMSALYYPIVVMSLASVIVSVVLYWVIPRFQEFWDQAGKPLPALTQMLVNVSEIFRDKAFGVVLIASIAMITYSNVNGTRRGKMVIDRIKLGLPVFGTLIQKSSVARFARTLGTLLDAGVPILQSLVIVKDASGNEVVARAVGDISASVRDGETVSEPMRSHRVFPSLVPHMIAVGEETGAIDQMLNKVADAYEMEVDAAVDGLTSLMEPVLIVVLGVIIGTIVVALYGPLIGVIDLFE